MMGKIINEIWNLPWYKVFVIAVVDDVILVMKLWFVWLGIAILFLVGVITMRKMK